MQLKLNQNQYDRLKMFRDQFDNAKNNGSYQGISLEYKRALAGVYGELFGVSRAALNYECGSCLLAALKQFQPLLVEFETSQRALGINPDCGCPETQIYIPDIPAQMIQEINEQHETEITQSRHDRITAKSRERHSRKNNSNPKT